MSVDERLGIELNLDLTQIRKQVQEAQKLIKDAFGNIDLSKLSQGMSHGVGDSKKFLQEFAKQSDISYKNITDLKKQVADLKREISARGLASKFLNLDRDVTELEKFRQKIRDTKIEVQSKATSNFVAGLSKQGLKYDNGSVIPKSYLTNKNEAWDAAIKYNNALKVQNEQMLSLNGKQISLNDAISKYSNYLTGLHKQGKGLWKDKEVSLSQYNKELGKTNGNVKNVFGNMLQLAGLEARFYGVRTILFTVTAQLREAVSAVLDFNQAIHDTAAISGASLSSMRGLEEVALNMASSSRFTTSQIMDTIKTLAQAGVKESDIPKVAQSSVLFATGASATSDQSVKLMTTSMNVFKLKAEDTGRIANALTAALNASKLEAGGLSTSFNYLANTAGQAGMSLESTLGIVASMSQVISRDSTIGTGMSQVIAQLLSPRGRFKKLLENNNIKSSMVDPSKNEFADIIGQFEKANISAKEVYQSGMTMNVARALVAAINVGSQGFREMTEAITGTDAALIANYKVMDGARAKINVLKQEWVTSINEIGKSTSFLASAGLESLRNLAIGVGTSGGQIAVGSTVIVAGLGAIAFAAIKLVEAVAKAGSILKLLASTNVWTASITIGLTAVAGVIAYLGREQKLQKAANEAFVKGIAETAGKVQGAVTGLIELRGALKGVEKDKNGKLLLTDELKLSIIKLINEYPAYLSELDKERIMHGNINDLIREKKKLLGQTSDQASNAYNYLETFRVDNASKFKTTGVYKIAQEAGAKYGVTDNEGDPFKFVQRVEEVLRKNKDKFLLQAINMLTPQRNEYETYNNNLVARQKSYEPAISRSIKGTGVLRNGVLSSLYETPDALKEKGDTPEKPAPPTTTEVRAAEALDKRLGEIITNNKIALAKARIEEKELELEAAKLAVVDYENTLDYKTKAKSLLDQKYNLKIYELRLEANKRAASAVQGKVDYDSEGNPTTVSSGMHDGKPIFSKTEVEKQVKEAQEWLNQMKANAEKELVNSQTKIDKTGDPKQSSDYYVKQADKRMMIEMKTFQLRKEQAKTAEEVRNIEKEEVEMQIHMNSLKEQYWLKDLENLKVDGEAVKKKQELGIALEPLETRYVNILDNLEAINQQTEEWKNKLVVISKVDPWYNFKKGVKDAIRDFGTFSDNVQAFGRSITNQAADGITGVIDTTLSTFTFPDREKIGALKQEISELESEKSITEQKIAAIQTKSIKSADDVVESQKLQGDLEKINNEISKQKGLLDDQTNAWKRFKTALGSILTDIGKEIQKFLIGQAVQGLFKLMVRVFGSGVPELSGDQLTASKWDNSGTVWGGGSGYVGEYADGGPIPGNIGIPGVDSVPIMAMPKEYIIPVSSHEYYGTQFLDAIKNKQLRKFADGGTVSSQLAGTRGGNSGSNQEFSLVINNYIDPNRIIAKTNATEVLNVIALDTLQNGPVIRTIKASLRGN